MFALFFIKKFYVKICFFVGINIYLHCKTKNKGNDQGGDNREI